MALVNLKFILKDAVSSRYAVGAFNAANHSMADVILDASQETGLPVILSVAESHFKYFKLDQFVRFLKSRIEQTSTPVVLHLDHCTDMEILRKALDLGFSSVMIDASTAPYAENVRITSEAVRLARAFGISVEAELGLVGGAEGDLGARNLADRAGYTQPEQAASFAEETEIDALAIAIGTVHGLYQGEPRLQFDLLQEIRSRVDIPLVLHGGSGLSRKDFRKAIEFGINKVNVFTENSLAAAEEIRQLVLKPQLFGYPDLVLRAEKKMKEIILALMEVFGTQPLRGWVN